jgi:hypothetical protein
MTPGTIIAISDSFCSLGDASVAKEAELRLHPAIGGSHYNVEFCARYIIDAGEFAWRGPGAFTMK